MLITVESGCGTLETRNDGITDYKKAYEKCQKDYKTIADLEAECYKKYGDCVQQVAVNRDFLEKINSEHKKELFKKSATWFMIGGAIGTVTGIGLTALIISKVKK